MKLSFAIRSRVSHRSAKDNRAAGKVAIPLDRTATARERHHERPKNCRAAPDTGQAARKLTKPWQLANRRTPRERLNIIDRAQNVEKHSRASLSFAGHHQSNAPTPHPPTTSKIRRRYPSETYATHSPRSHHATSHPIQRHRLGLPRHYQPPKCPTLHWTPHRSRQAALIAQRPSARPDRHLCGSPQ